MAVAVTYSGLALERGERQLWTGTPRRGLVLRPWDAITIPFGAVATAFSVFWEVSVLRTPAPGFFAIFGLPFILAGLYLMVGRPIADALRRRRTTYVLTTDRVIIRTGSNTKSLPLATIGDASLTERSDGSGTIRFSPTGFSIAGFVGTPLQDMMQLPAFEGIPAARQVHARILDARQAARANPGTLGGSSPPDASAAPTAAFTPPPPSRGGRLLAATVIGLFGVAIAYVGGADWYAGMRSTSWPTTAGVVLESEVLSRWASGSQRGLHYTPHVSYRYRVRDRSFSGDRVSYDRWVYGDGSRNARRVVRAHIKGTAVQVHYDPARPERSVLQPGWVWPSVAQTIVGLLLLLAARGVYRLMGRPQSTRPPLFRR